MKIHFPDSTLASVTGLSPATRPLSQEERERRATTTAQATRNESQFNTASLFSAQGIRKIPFQKVPRASSDSRCRKRTKFSSCLGPERPRESNFLVRMAKRTLCASFPSNLTRGREVRRSRFEFSGHVCLERITKGPAFKSTVVAPRRVFPSLGKREQRLSANTALYPLARQKPCLANA
jgi:hypothetical protein